MKKKFILEFDKEPAILFIQQEVGNDFKVYQDGLLVNGIRTIRIDASYDQFTSHEIEYVTGATKPH